MSYGDLGMDEWDDSDSSICYTCGASQSISTLQCYSCRQPVERPVRPEDVGFYVSGWIWDDEFPELQHRSLHSFGPFETEAQALRVMENLAGPTDDSDLKPSLWKIEASEVQKPEKGHKEEAWFRDRNGVKNRLPLAKKVHTHRNVWSEDY